MVHISNNGVISIHRGDSFSIPLFLDMGIEGFPIRYNITQYTGVSLYLGVMTPFESFEKATLKKKYTSESETNENGDLVVKVSSQDTMCLRPGKYYYEMKMLLENGEVSTIIPKKELFVFE